MKKQKQNCKYILNKEAPTRIISKKPEKRKWRLWTQGLRVNAKLEWINHYGIKKNEVFFFILEVYQITKIK